MSQVERRFEDLRREYWPEVRRTIDKAVEVAGLGESTLSMMLDYHLDTGGKRLRAILPMMVAEALGEGPEAVVAFGAACELIHNATLVHDDLQDGDRMRRGEETIWVRFGQAQAINLGDALLYLAPTCLDLVGVTGDRRWQVARRMFRDVLVVVDGQEREFGLKYETVTAGGYEEMVVGKTSGLFALPMAGAAELCGAEEAVVAGLEASARELGVIFQIQDDILDLYGEKGRQSRGGDIKEGKISALVVAFQEVASAQERERLNQILRADRDETSDEDVAWALEAIRQRGALAKTLQAIDSRRARLISADAIRKEPRLKELIEGLATLFLRPIEGVRVGV